MLLFFNGYLFALPRRRGKTFSGSPLRYAGCELYLQDAALRQSKQVARCGISRLRRRLQIASWRKSSLVSDRSQTCLKYSSNWA
jgi:hypothetical protein